MPVHLDTARRLELGYLSPHDPSDRRAFSGTSFYAARALAAHPGVNLHVLGSQTGLGRVFRRRKAADVSCLDAVIGLAASRQLDAFMTWYPDLPVLHITDATPRYLRESYGWDIPEAADQLETRVVSRAAATIYSSPEMAARAPSDLGLPGLTPHFQHFGLNIDPLPATCPEKAELKRLKLLFVGIDWHRKGGDVAIRVLDLLRRAGLDAELTLVGKPPMDVYNRPGVRVAGYLDKNRPGDRAKLGRYYTESHLLLLPSRADCTPMVVTEALAHGTPVIGTETGGMASLLGSHGAGLLLARRAGSRTWCDEIRQISGSPEIYHAMSKAAFDRAKHGLSWCAWAQRIHDIAREICASRGSGADAA